jgi:hypothetical protein
MLHPTVDRRDATPDPVVSGQFAVPGRPGQ